MGLLVAHGKCFPIVIADQYNRFGLSQSIGYTKFSEQIWCKVTLFYSVEESSLKVLVHSGLRLEQHWSGQYCCPVRSLLQDSSINEPRHMISNNVEF